MKICRSCLAALPSANLHMQLELAGGDRSLYGAVTVARPSSTPLSRQSAGQYAWATSVPGLQPRRRAATATPSTGATQPLGPPPVPPPADGGGGWTTGVIVGLSVGVGAALVALVLLAVWLWKDWSRRSADAAQARPHGPPPQRQPPQAHQLPRPPASASLARRQ